MSNLIRAIPLLLAVALFVSMILKLALNNFSNYVQFVLVYFVLAGSKISLEFTQKGFEILGLNVYFSDLIILINLILLFLAKRPNKAREFEVFLGCIWLLFYLVILGIFLWSIELGLKPGWNNWRIFTLSFSLFLVAKRHTLYINHDQIKRVFLFPCILDFLLTYIHIFEFGLGTAEDTNLTTGLGLGRPITASGALIIMYTFFYYINTSKISLSYISILIICLVTLIIVQHRSVWLATLGGVVTWVIGNRQILRIPSRILFLSILGLFTLVTYLSFDQLQVSAKSTNTLEWRITRWQDSFKVARSAYQWALGAVFGPTSVQMQEGADFKVFAHNSYVATIESFGFVGVFLLIIFLVSRLHSSFRSEDPLISNMLLISAYIYGFFYWIEPSYWLLLGFFSAINLPKSEK